jgi:hypothetical protein
MRFTVLLVAMLVLGGCAEQPQPLDAPASQSSIEVPTQLPEGPVDDPSLPRAGADGQTPEDVVLALVSVLNQQDWESAYALYAQPYVDYEQALQNWTSNPESYKDFRVLETRVEREDLAFVLIEYSVLSEDPDSAEPARSLSEPTWWAVDKVDGRWKTRWMPAQ